MEQTYLQDILLSVTSYLTLPIRVFTMMIKFIELDSYKPGESYAVFVGKDVSVALAKMSFEDKYYNAYDKTKLTLAEVDTLNGWFDYMKKKYKIVAEIRSTKKDE